MTLSWFIDTLDARAGVVFASHREADLATAQQDLDLPTVFISAPDFVPAAVSSRAIAFAAARSAPQTGLFLKEREIGFPSLDSLVEFVKRAYGASGGGDGAGGGGTVPPTPEGPRGPERGSEIGSSSEGEDPPLILGECVGSLKSIFERQGQAVQSSILERLHLSSGSAPASIAFATEIDLSISVSTHGFVELAAIGVAEIASEIMMRCPSAGSGGLAAWWDSLRRLTMAAERLRLLPLVAKQVRFKDWAAAGRHMANCGLDWPFEDAVKKAIAASSTQNEAASAYAYAASATFLQNDFFYFLGTRTKITSPTMFREILSESYTCAVLEKSDRFEDVGAWPLPESVSHLLHNKRSSVADYLAFATNAPTAVGSPSASELAILAFAALHLTTTFSASGSRYRTVEPVLDAWHNEISRRAMDWLVQQMPSLAFPEQVEQIFRDCAELRYA